MSLRNTESSYGTMSKTLHWAIMIIVLVMLLVGSTMGYIPLRPLRIFVYNIHKLLGLSAMVLMIFFAIWTLFNPKPIYPDNMKPWQLWLAKAVRISFYVAIIAMPLVGWIFSTAAGHAPSLLGLVKLPAPAIPVNKTLAHLGHDIHHYLAWFILALVIIHLCGALTHRFIFKDQVWQRMLGHDEPTPKS